MNKDFFFRSLSCNDSFSIVFDEDASKDPHLTTVTPEPDNTPKNSLSTYSSRNTNTLSKNSRNASTDVLPNMLSKHGSGDNDDSFIMFANTGDLENSAGLSEARNLSNKVLEKIKEVDTFKDSQSYNKKKVSFKFL